jgi:hypothetical protein
MQQQDGSLTVLFSPRTAAAARIPTQALGRETMFWNPSAYVPNALRTAATIAGWIAVYLLGSYAYFALTYHLLVSTPAMLIPSLIPLSAFSAWVSWQIEEQLEPAYVEPPVCSREASILPLLYMSVFYSSIVEGFLYEWFLHGGLRPWLRIALDLFWLSPFFTDAAATYVYKRFLGETHDGAANYVATRLPSFIVPLLGLWFVFSVAGNEISNPILSFMVFDVGIIVWTVFFTWANRVDLPGNLRSSRYRFVRRLGVLNDILSRPLGRVYRWKYFGAYLRDLVILIFSLAVACELWLANVASTITLAAIVVLTFASWKVCEFWKEGHRPADFARTATRATKESEHTIRWPVEIRLNRSDAGPCAAEDAVELVLRFDQLHTPATMAPLSVEQPLHELET